MFDLKVFIMAAWMTVTVFEKDDDRYNVLLQTCTNPNGCAFRGTFISWHVDEPLYKEGDRVLVSGHLECHGARGVDERVVHRWVSYKSYICNGIELSIRKSE